MDKNNKFVKILRLVLDQIAELYPYFLVIYFVSLVLSLFFERWKLFFNWEIFHLSVVLFGILSLFSERGRKLIRSRKKLLVASVKGLPRPNFRKEALKIERLSKKDYLKIGITATILAYTLYKGINPINFLVLAYALVSVLFVTDSRIAAGIALTFLVSCPALLILKKESLAEIMAIYAYYFLVICVATQIREYASRASPPRNLSTD